MFPAPGGGLEPPALDVTWAAAPVKRKGWALTPGRGGEGGSGSDLLISSRNVCNILPTPSQPPPPLPGLRGWGPGMQVLLEG